MSGREDIAARIRRRRLAGLADPLEAVKRRDAAALAEVQSLIAEAEARVAALRGALAEATAAFDPSDLEGAAALDVWRRATRRRIAEQEAQIAALRPVWEAARETLARSNGEAEAVKRLTRSR